MNKKNILYVVSLTALTLMSFAMAQTVGDVAKGLTWNVYSLSKIFIPFCFVAGLCLSIKAIFQLKAHSDTKGKVPLTNCILYICAGATLMSISGFIGIGKEMMGVGDTNAHDIKQYVQEPKY